MFGHILSFDNEEFDSYKEKDVYEFIKLNTNLKYIESIGTQHYKGKYIFELDDDYEYTRFCPDFVINYIDDNNKKVKLSKPIIIEYYGMYEENNPNSLIKKYIQKTKTKEQFYKSRNDIYYIGLFPEDIEQNFKGLIEKLSSFFMFNFNINIHNTNKECAS
jgi:hypothetical protein